MDTVAVTLGEVTSVSSTEPTLNIELVPNPTNDAAWLNFSLHEEVRMDIEIYNATGELILGLAKQKHFATGEHRFLLPSKDWPAGPYLILIRTNGELTVRQLLKQ